MKTLKNFALLVIAAAVMYGQSAITSTTLSLAVDSTVRQFVVASATGITGVGTNQQVGSLGYCDRELVRVVSVSSTTLTVDRGQQGTPQTSHAVSTTCYFGGLSTFINHEPSGSCTSTQYAVLPVVSIPTGKRFDCPTSGPSSGVWAVVGTAEKMTFADGRFWIPPGNCSSAVATTAYASGYPINTVAATGNPVYQVTTNTTAGTITINCPITVPTRETSGRGVTVTSVTLYYGVQTTDMSSIAAATVKSVTHPTSTSGGAAAAGTVADAGGSLTVTPGTLQLATTTTGLCYAERITLGTPFATNTNNVRHTINQVFTTAGTSATTLQICGVEVEYTTVPL